MDQDSYDESSDSSDHERLAIRDELKSMSFEELLKLKQEIGAKSYNSSVFKSKLSSTNPKCENKPLKKDFNRTNKNRPREESSKVPVKSLFKVSNRTEAQARDPRFDSLCGEFNENAFSKNYAFVNSIKETEINKLQNLLRKEKDPEEKAKIKLALERMKNQKRSRQVREGKLLESQSQRVNNLQLIKEGRKPHFRRKGEKKALSLIDKYEKLKADGKLEKYVKKKNKEQSRKVSFKQPNVN